MGKYNGAVITTAGQNVIAQSLSGTQLTWTVMRSSSAAIPAGTNLEELTSLSSVEQTTHITDATVYGNNVVQVSARFANTNISTAYYIRTVGIYGQLAGGSETLIAVMTAVTPDEMPVYDPDAPSAFIFNVHLTVQNAQNVTMTVNDTGTATVADLNRKVDVQSGNVSNTVVTTITTSSAAYPSIAAGDTVAVAAGKVNKNLSDLGSNKLDKTGDAANAKIGSSTASTASYPVPAANDTFKVILGKIIKFFADIKAAYTNVSISGKDITFTTAAGGTKKITTQDTTYSNMTAATASAAGKAGLVPAPGAGKQGQYLRGDATWATPANTTYSAGSGLSMSGTTINHGASVTAGTAGTSAATSGRNTLAIPYVTYNNTGHVTAAGTHTHTINNFAAASSASAGGAVGLVPAPAASWFNDRAKVFLCGNGGWSYLPLQNNTTTTATGYALDARMGKTLQDRINARNPQISAIYNNAKAVNVPNSTDTTTCWLSLPAGVYIIYGRADFAANGTGRRFGTIATSTNNGQTWTQYAAFNTVPVPYFFTTQCMTDIISCASASVATVRVWQDSGTTLEATGTVTAIRLY